MLDRFRDLLLFLFLFFYLFCFLTDVFLGFHDKFFERKLLCWYWCHIFVDLFNLWGWKICCYFFNNCKHWNLIFLNFKITGNCDLFLTLLLIFILLFPLFLRLSSFSDFLAIILHLWILIFY